MRDLNAKTSLFYKQVKTSNLCYYIHSDIRRETHFPTHRQVIKRTKQHSAIMNPLPSNFVPMHHVDREWDARFNVPTDHDLQELQRNIEEMVRDSKIRYVLIGGVEIGNRPFQDDFKIRHVHVAFIFVNRVSKSAILKNTGFKQGNGYYLVPRNRAYPYSGWKKHHSRS